MFSKIKQRIPRWAVPFVLIAVLLVSAMGYQLAFGYVAEAGPQIVGNPNGATSRVLMAPAANGSVKRIVYFNGTGPALITPAGGTTTPVTSSAVCNQGGASIYRADVYLTGTMTGTNPTVAMLWQNSIDGGVTWTSVGTWTTINATVTPASQSQTVADQAATTAVAYGDCWRTQLTFGGTGAVGANLEVVGYAK